MTGPDAVLRPKRREPWWLELILVAGVYWIYSWVADQAPRAAALKAAAK